MDHPHNIGNSQNTMLEDPCSAVFMDFTLHLEVWDSNPGWCTQGKVISCYLTNLCMFLSGMREALA